MQRTEPALAHSQTTELKQLLQIACSTALSAGRLIKDRFHQPHDIRMKGVINLVTETDLAAEAQILETLTRETPDIPVMSYNFV